jgi:hypothetical protein
MKNLLLFIMLAGCILTASCKKENQSEKFRLLTGPVWASDSLLVNGADASGPGGLLNKFKGNAMFNTDYTGTFGVYTGTWRFAANESQLVITSDSLPFPLTTNIVELTTISLKVTTSFPLVGSDPINVRMTFKAK